MAAPYSTLLSEIQIGHKTLRNRIVKTAAGSRYWSQNGFVTDRVKALFDKISAGGAAMVVVDTMAFMPWNDARFTMGGVWHDKYIPGLKELVDLVHNNGALIIGQLHHAGPADFKDPIGPSVLTENEMPLNDPSPRALTLDEIESMKQYYYGAVERLVKANFDGVEVHAAHSYFLASFLTRVWNKRIDQYGINSFEDRTRLVREIIREVRNNTPEDFIIGVRFNGIEFGNERALTIEESCRIAKLLETESPDYFSITGEGFGKIKSPMLYLPVDYFPYPEPDEFMKPFIHDFETQGTLIPAAAAIKKEVNIPVICVGRLDENIAEEVLSQKKADIAGFNRALWADPDMPKKLIEGRSEDIRHCTRCGTCEGGGKIATMGPRVCRVNPSLGNYDLEIKRTTNPKKVIVIGGGPAGMEAACTAAACGHKVALYEKSAKLGGHLPLASLIKGTYLDNVDSILNYLIHMTNKLGVEVHTKTSADMDLIKQKNPDAVILATGGKYKIDSINGESKKNHTDVNRLQKTVELPLRVFGPKLINFATNFMIPNIGKNVVIIGSGIAGLQGALWLKKKKRNVNIVSFDDKIADQMPPRYRNRLLPWFEKNNVSIINNVDSLTLIKNKLLVERNKQTIEIDCDTAISLPGMNTSLSLLPSLKKQGIEAYVIGSAREIGNDLIVDAIHDGRKFGLAI